MCFPDRGTCVRTLHTLYVYATVIVCYEVFHCEIHGMVPLLILICYLSIVYRNGDGMGTVVCGMNGDGDDLETSCGDRVGDGD